MSRTTRPETVAYLATSLDGFIARTDGDLDWLPAPTEGEDFGWAEFLSRVDAIAMGHITFDTVLGFDGWPYEGTPVFVLTRSGLRIPTSLAGKATCVSLIPPLLLDHLASKGHRRIYVDGGGLIQSFLRHDLLDELVVTSVPILIGNGIPLFGRLQKDMPWTHVATQTYPGGLVKSGYRRRR